MNEHTGPLKVCIKRSHDLEHLRQRVKICDKRSKPGHLLQTTLKSQICDRDLQSHVDTRYIHVVGDVLNQLKINVHIRSAFVDLIFCDNWSKTA